MNMLFKTITVAALLSCSAAHATIVEVKTNLGSFEINLFDQSTPITVQNFINYTNNERYNNTVIHRSVPGFVLQGGGFKFDTELPLKATQVNAAIKNEPKWSNIRGTVAMAKLGGNPNSATNQWFINLNDNSNGKPKLDSQNGGYTVFGQVNAQGMEIIDAMAALPRFDFPSITELPLKNYTAADRDDNKALVASNFITIESITVVDSRNDTDSAITKVPTTSTGDNNPGPIISSGSTGLISLFGLMFIAVRRRLTR